MGSKLEVHARSIALLARSGYPIIYVLTHEEERALVLIKKAAEASKREFHRWSITQGFTADRKTQGDPNAALEWIGKQECPALFTLIDFHPYLTEPSLIRHLRELSHRCANRGQSIILLGARLEVPSELEKDVAVVDLPLPDLKNLTTVINETAKSEGREIDTGLAERAARSALGLTQNQAQRVFRKVMVMQRGLKTEDLTHIVSSKKDILRSQDVVEFFELQESIENLGGLDELKQWLASRTSAFTDEARAFGIPPPKGLLLLGVQGCGKSLAAKAVANLWKFPLLRLDFGSLFSNRTLGPEGAFRLAIKIAESLSPVVLWIDELEKGLGGASRSEQSNHILGSFISWLSEKSAHVFVVATANDVSALPPELLRRGRFDEIFFVDLPNAHERLEILEVHLKKRGRSPDNFVGLNELAAECLHFSGAELEQVVIAGLHQAFAERRNLNIEDLRQSAKMTVPLFRSFEESIKKLRDWASSRARPASTDTRMIDMFGANS